MSGDDKREERRRAVLAELDAIGATLPKLGSSVPAPETHEDAVAQEIESIRATLPPPVPVDPGAPVLTVIDGGRED